MVPDTGEVFCALTIVTATIVTTMTACPGPGRAGPDADPCVCIGDPIPHTTRHRDSQTGPIPALPRPDCFPQPPCLPSAGPGSAEGFLPLGGLEQRCAWAVKLAPFCPSGVVPEDQAQYVCEAQNMFGKVRAEAQLVVTGHGSLVELGEEGLGGRSGPLGRPPPWLSTLWNRCVLAQFSKRSLWTPPSWAACPRKCTLDLSASLILMLPLVPWEGEGGQWGLCPPDDHPWESG